MIEVKGVSRYFGRNVAVENLTFTVRKGEILGLLGPNGAGKTTTMRMITGFLPPSQGQISVSGYDVSRDPLEVKRRVGYLPEGAPLYREMTVNDYLTLLDGLKGCGKPSSPGNVDRVLSQTELGPVRHRVIGNLSRGYRQRVGLAQALLRSPEILILDEPTSGLDPKQIIDIRELIRSLAGEHTVVLSSHILPEIQMTCQRVVIISGGRLVAEDTADNLAQTLSGQRTMCVRIKGPREGVNSLLCSLDGVTGVAPQENGGDNDCQATYLVDQEPAVDIRENMFFALAEKGWPIMEMTHHHMSLEDVFLKLTTREPEIEQDLVEEG